MSFQSLLVHTATILRRQDGEDRFGDPDNDFVPLTTNVPCRVTVSSLGGGFANIGGERLDEHSLVIMEDRRIYLPAGTDVAEEDRVIVNDKNGNQVVPLSDVNFVRRIFNGRGDEHHVEVLFKVWREGDAA